MYVCLTLRNDDLKHLDLQHEDKTFIQTKDNYARVWYRLKFGQYLTPFCSNAIRVEITELLNTDWGKLKNFAINTLPDHLYFELAELNQEENYIIELFITMSHGLATDWDLTLFLTYCRKLAINPLVMLEMYAMCVTNKELNKLFLEVINEY